MSNVDADLDDKEAECRHLRGRVNMLEAKLSKAVAIAEDAIETMESGPFFPEKEARRLRATIAELKGDKDA